MIGPTSVNNGRRVDLPFANGPAGLVEKDDAAQLSFEPVRGHRPRVGTTITIDETTYDVVSVEQSKTVKTMVVLSLVRKPVDG